jgi:predicted DNA-binding transcriptional regulator AlpA
MSANPTPPTDRKFITTPELAALLKVSRRTICLWTKSGRLPPPLQISPKRFRWDVEAVLARLT